MLPRPTFTEPAEPFASPWGERECDQRPKPGVEAFATFVHEHQGGHIGRIVGPCGVKSGHASGRAWDWMISAIDPEQRARAEELIAWLLANDAEIFRRAGLRYLIWDKRVYTSLTGAWKPYDGYDERGQCARPPCRHPHTDHVHFSFSKEGAAGQTSFFRWLRGEQPSPGPTPGPGPARQKPPVAPPIAPVSLAPAVVGFVVGFAGIALYERLSGPNTRRSARGR